MKKNRFLFLIALAMFIALPFKVDAMSLKAYDYNGYEKTIDVEDSDTIEAVKEKIGMEADKTAEDTILVLNGKELENGRTVLDYSIKSTDVLYMLGDAYLTFNTNGGVFENYPESQTEWIVPGYAFYTDEQITVKRDGYTFKEWYTEPDGGYYFDYYFSKLEMLETTKFYAHWEQEGTITIDFTKIKNINNLSYIEQVLFEHFGENEGYDVEGESLKDKNGKTLFSFDDNGNIILNKDLTVSDNITFTVTEADKQILSQDLDYIPDTVKFIFSTKQVVKVTFDANGGTINGNSQYVVENFKDSSDAPEPTREGYYLKGWYTKPVGGIYIADFEEQISNGMTVYAHWEKEGLVTIDFANMEDVSEISYIEAKWFNYLIYNDIIIITLDSNTIYYKNKEGKVLITEEIDANDNIKLTITPNLTVADNVIHVLTLEEKEQLRQEGETDIPDRIEVIFSTKQAEWELDEEVPKTLDNITSSMIVGTISLIGLVGATIYFRKRNKEGA